MVRKHRNWGARRTAAKWHIFYINIPTTTTTTTLNYTPRNHPIALRSALSLLAKQASIESDGTIKAWNFGLPEGVHGESLLSLTEYEAQAKIPVEASVRIITWAGRNSGHIHGG